MDRRKIRARHLYTDHREYYRAVEDVRDVKGRKRDVMPLPHAWYMLAKSSPSDDAFIEFVNSHPIENWVFDDGEQFAICFRLSDFKREAILAGLMDETSIR